MKTAMVIAAAALGLSVSVASACPYKRDTTASTDRQLTVASIASSSASTPADATAVKTKKAQ